MKKRNQTTDVLKYLKTHKKGITTFVAYERFGATRLADIIYRLRRKGHIIDTVAENTVNRYGEQCEIARYIYNGFANRTAQ